MKYLSLFEILNSSVLVVTTHGLPSFLFNHQRAIRHCGVAVFPAVECVKPIGKWYPHSSFSLSRSSYYRLNTAKEVCSCFKWSMNPISQAMRDQCMVVFLAIEYVKPAGKWYSYSTFSILHSSCYRLKYSRWSIELLRVKCESYFARTLLCS